MPPDVAPADAVTLGQFLKRSSAACLEILKPRAPARERFEQHRITSRAVALVRQSGEHQLGFDATPFELDCRRQLDRAIALVAHNNAAPHLDDDPLLVNDHLRDESLNGFGSLRR